MQILIPEEKFDISNVLFCNRTDNTVISGGGFYRIMYCTKDISILGIQIKFDVELDGNNENDFNKYRTIATENTSKKLSELIKCMYDKWCVHIQSQSITVQQPQPHSYSHNMSKHNSFKPLSQQSINFNVEPIVSKALDKYRKKHMNNMSSQNKKSELIKLKFIFKCSGVYDTDNEAGVSFRLNIYN